MSKRSTTFQKKRKKIQSTSPGLLIIYSKGAFTILDMFVFRDVHVRIRFEIGT